MRILLKAMGFWVWGLIAIGLSVSFVTLSYRLASIFHGHGTAVIAALSETTSLKAPSEPSAVSSPDQSLPQVANLSRVIAEDMRAADTAMHGGQWNEALRNLQTAQTKSPLTQYDVSAIDDFKAFAYARLNNLIDAQSAYEAERAAGKHTSRETIRLLILLFRLATTNQQYSKATAYGEQLAESGAASADNMAILSQIYYLQKDCKDSTVWADRAIATGRKAGQKSKENLFQFKLQCASDSADKAAMVTVLFDLIRLTNKSSYWNTLLRIERQDERDDHNTLMIYRIMYDTGSMGQASDYIEMAQLLGDASRPGEALAVLEKANRAGLIKDEQQARTARLLNSFKADVEAAKEGQSQLKAEAVDTPTGDIDFKLGALYFGLGDYQNSVIAINRGLQKGQAKRTDEGYVDLGRSQVALKNTTEAKTAFSQLKTALNMSPQVINLWNLYAETIG